MGYIFPRYIASWANMLILDGLEEDEDLGLLFNEFVIETRKIPLKFVMHFKKMSKFILERVPQECLKEFVEQYKEILESGNEQTFCSILEMVDYFNRVINNHPVGITRIYTLYSRVLTHVSRSTVSSRN